MTSTLGELPLEVYVEGGCPVALLALDSDISCVVVGILLTSSGRLSLFAIALEPLDRGSAVLGPSSSMQDAVTASWDLDAV